MKQKKYIVTYQYGSRRKTKECCEWITAKRIVDHCRKYGGVAVVVDENNQVVATLESKQ